jgi:DNA-binding SARP family transcriptional activator
VAEPHQGIREVLMEFGVLGPLLVRVEDGPVTVPGPKQRALLAMLLLRANETVSTGLLAEAVWDGFPPPNAADALPTYVMRLRRALGVEAGARVVTRAGGYAVEVGADELDLSRFKAACARARTSAAAADWAATSDALTAGLALWRGEPLADVPAHRVLHDELQSLAELRLRAQQQRIDADLELGRHHDVIPELQRAIAAHPLHEPLRGQLMFALYRSGRQAEALEIYHATRRTLADELGVDPTPPLQELYRRILNADPTLTPAPVVRSPAQRSDDTVPRQLPAAVRHFAGRAAELKRLTELLDDTVATGGTVMISAIDGTAGIGKTALAVHWAHQVAPWFPDGQLYVNLRGFDPSGSPMTPTEAIRGFLDALGLPPQRIPADLAEQAALYRSRLADRRVLVVLDNARDVDQVRPLLPGTQGCLTVITSRNRLLGLVAAEGATPLTLDLLSHTEAYELLTRRIGAETVLRQQREVDELIELCARLPLALNIAAARAATQPARPLADLVAQLRDASGRLDTLDAGDATTDVRAVFSWSYRQLSAPAARLFRLIGIHPGPDISLPAVASLAGVPRDQARRSLDELTRAHLLTEHVAGRYALHDLLRTYAAEQANTHETAAARQAAVERALDYYLHTSHAASLLLYHSTTPIPMAPPAAGVEPEHLAGLDAALAWYTAEYAVLVTAVTWAVDTGSDRQAHQLARTLRHFFQLRGHWRDYMTTHQDGLAAARRLDDRVAQSGLHRGLGWANTRLGAYVAAEKHYSRAIELHRELDDFPGLGYTLITLGELLAIQQEHDRALDCARQALELFRATDNRSGLADALNAVGWHYAQRGDCREALTYCREALELHQEIGNRAGQADTWDSLGYAHHHLAEYADAVVCYRHAVRLRQESGDRSLEAAALDCLGDTYLAMDDADAAHDVWEQALAILTDLDLDLDHADADAVRAKLAQLG